MAEGEGRAKSSTRREAIAIEAVNPLDGKPLSVIFSHARLQAVGRRSKGQVMDAALLVPQVLAEPRAIFEGLKREEDEGGRDRSAGWLCYCGVPDRSYTEDGEEAPPRKGRVFLVFVDKDCVAYMWYWVKCDPEDDSLPEDHAERFGRRAL